MAGKSVNDTTNNLSTSIVFGKDKQPHDQFNYRDLSQPVYFDHELMNKYNNINDKLNWVPDEIDFWDQSPTVPFNSLNKPMYDFLHDNHILPLKFTAWNGEKSVLPFFPGYKFEYGKSTYRGVEVGEGGYVYAEPGVHENVALLDVASMHPTSMITECLFGPKYTKRFKDLKDARVAIKHNDNEALKTMLDGMLFEILKEGTYSTKALGGALKTPINSAYGLTSASFNNPFRDIRNKDNIVAKRGALFMIDLMNEVQSRGFTVAHIKTDSIKIPNATPEIIKFVMDFGREYGYEFEHEATYKKMCLVNNAVYIAKFMTEEECIERYGYAPGECKEEGGHWTATGTQFQVPYVFKKLFSKEPIEFSDLCETKSVTSLMYLNMDTSIPNESVNSESMHFVGKVGSFCPMKEGSGGYLLREAIDKNTNEKKYGFVVGTKGYYWLESDMVKELNKQEYIDRSYYENMVNEAVEAIEKYVDFEWFAS